MRKAFLYMTGKNIPSISLILLLTASMTLVGVSADPLPYISLNPMEYEAPAPGESFTIDVNVTDVTDLYGFEFELYYNTTLLDAVNVTPGPVVPETRFFGPLDPDTGEWIPIDDTLGRVWVACAFMPPATSFTGNGTLMTINFTATTEGSGALHFDFTELVDSNGDIMYHTALDDSVTVIPEFPATIVTPLLLITTLAAAFLGKMVWSRKRKDALITE